MATQDIAAVEYANLLAVPAAEADLAPRLFTDPVAVLRELHGLVAQRLVDVAHIGALRRTEQAVHDGAQGMVIYAPPQPAALPGLMAELAGWLTGASLTVPPVIVAGVVHEKLLEWQPFEAGNGRVARAAARLVLHAHGLDRHGAAVLERPLAADPLGYHREVAATIRRRGDLQRWLERHTAAVAAAFEHAVDVLAPRPVPDVPERVRATLAALGPTLSLADYATRAGGTLRQARDDLTAAARAGLVAEDPGSSGLRFRQTTG